VIGGGPAGCACALAAAQLGSTVALFEAQRELSDKPCGEGIMPAGVEALRDLGLGDVIASGAEFRSLRYVLPKADPFEIRLPSPGIAIDRPRLMQALELELQRCIAVKRFFGRVDVERSNDARSDVRFRIHSRSCSVRARALVAADGLKGSAAAWLRAAAQPTKPSHPTGDRWRLGLRARYTVARALDGVEVHFNRGTEIYLTPLAGGRINVSVLLDGDERSFGGAASMLQRALQDNPLAASHLSTCVTEPAARVLTCRIPPVVARDAAFLAGDAGGGIDPILGCGVTLALESGILAARAAHAIVAGDVPGDPERSYAREYRARTQNRRRLARFLLALSDHPLLARGTFRLARMSSRLTDPLVRIAAGDAGVAACPGAVRSNVSCVPRTTSTTGSATASTLALHAPSVTDPGLSPPS
jgi:flavin-dependent dehydrogenase